MTNKLQFSYRHFRTERDCVPRNITLWLARARKARTKSVSWSAPPAITNFRPSGCALARKASIKSSNPFSGTSRPTANRSEEHTSELQSLMRISYAVFCLKKKKNSITAQKSILNTKTKQHQQKKHIRPQTMNTRTKQSNITRKTESQ